MKTTGTYPIEYEITHRSTSACAVFSLFLFDMVRKIQLTATEEQVKKYKELQQAYIDIVNDVSHVNRLEFLVSRYENRLQTLLNENQVLQKENKKLLETINFNEL